MSSHPSLNKSLQVTLKKLMPSFVSEDHETFVEFMQAYIAWMEQEGYAQELLTEFPNYKNIDKTIDEFLTYFHDMYYKDIPANIKCDDRLLAKHIKNLYISKGSLPAYKLLFRILFNENVEVYYPGDDVLRTSDGRWIEDKVIYISNVDGTDIVGLQLRGTTTNCLATIESSANILNPAYEVDNSLDEYVTQCYISNIIGNIDNETNIEISNFDGQIVFSGKIFKIYTKFNVNNGGHGYAVGDTVSSTDWGTGSVVNSAIVTNVGKNGEIKNTQINTFELYNEFKKEKNLLINDTIPEFITVNRNSIASYFDSDKKLKFVNPLEPRFNHSPLTGESLGLYNEPSATNYVYSSNNFTNPLQYSTTGFYVNVDNLYKSPEGIYNLNSILENTTSGNTHTLGLLTLHIEYQKPYVISVYIKKAATSKQWMQMYAGSILNNVYFNFNIVTGEIGSVYSVSNFISCGVIDCGDFWRVYMSFKGTNVTTLTYGIGIGFVPTSTSGRKGSSYTGDGVSKAWLYGFQQEDGIYPTSYIPTTMSAVTRDSENIKIDLSYFKNQLTLQYSGITSSTYLELDKQIYTIPTNVDANTYIDNILDGVLNNSSVTRSTSSTTVDSTGAVSIVSGTSPKILYNPKTHTCLGLLMETSATNKLISSDNVISTAGDFGPTNGTIAITALPGPVTGYYWSKYTENTTNDLHRVNTRAYTSNSGTNTASCFVKALGRQYVGLVLSMNGLTTYTAIFDIYNGTVVDYTGLTSANIEDYGNGVYKISATGTCTQSSGVSARTQLIVYDDTMNSTYAGDITKGVYTTGWDWVYGEAFSSDKVNSHIITNTAAVTRGEDFLTNFPYDLQHITFTYSDDTTQTITAVKKTDTIGASRLTGRLIKNIKFVSEPYTNNGVKYISFESPLTTNIETTSGTGANITTSVGTLGHLEGRWEGTYGQVSSDKKIEDNYYYQDYSYVLRSNVSVDSFKDIVKRIIHPAGFQMFGELFSEEKFITNISLSALAVSVYTILHYLSQVTFAFNLTSLGNSLKYIIQTAFAMVQNYKDVRLIQRKNMAISEYSTLPINFALSDQNEAPTPDLSVYDIGSLTPRPAIWFNRSIGASLKYSSMLKTLDFITSFPSELSFSRSHNTTSPIDVSWGSPSIDGREFSTRSSSGTYFNSSGVMSTASSNIARMDYDPITLTQKGILYEPSATNLQPYSDDQSQLTYWNQCKNITSTLFSSSFLPINIVTKHTCNASSDTQKRVASFFQWTGVAGTFSGYFKTSDFSYVHVRTANGEGGYGFCINVNTLEVTTGYVDGTGTLTMPTVYTVKRVKDFIYFSFYSPFSAIYIGLSPSNSATTTYTTTVGTEVFYTAAMDYQNVSIPTSHIPTTTAAATRAADFYRVPASFIGYNGKIQYAIQNTPRIDNNPQTNLSIGLLHEYSNTNLAWPSIGHPELGNINYSSMNNVTQSTGTTIDSPDGLTPWTIVTEDNTNNVHCVLSNAFPSTSGATMTASVFIKPLNRTRFCLGWAWSGSFLAFFDLSSSNGSVYSATNCTATVNPMGNGIFRVTATFTAPGTTQGIKFQALDNSYNQNYVGNNLPAFEWWGAQLEYGKQATSYIPTSSGSVTRNGDSISSILLTTIMNSTNLNSGTLYFEGSIDSNYGSAETILVRLSDVNDNNYSQFAAIDIPNYYNGLWGATYDGTLHSATSSYTPYENIKTAFSFKTGYSALFKNGVKLATTTDAYTIGLNYLYIGRMYNNYTSFCGHIRKISIYTCPLSDADSIALTT